MIYLYSQSPINYDEGLTRSEDGHLPEASSRPSRWEPPLFLFHQLLLLLLLIGEDWGHRAKSQSVSRNDGPFGTSDHLIFLLHRRPTVGAPRERVGPSGARSSAGWATTAIPVVNQSHTARMIVHSAIFWPSPDRAVKRRPQPRCYTQPYHASTKSAGSRVRLRNGTILCFQVPFIISWYIFAIDAIVSPISPTRRAPRLSSPLRVQPRYSYLSSPRIVQVLVHAQLAKVVPSQSRSSRR